MRNLGLSRPHRLLSTGTSPPICLSFAGWLSHHLLLRASASRHLSSRSHRTPPSLTPHLCWCQLVVALHLFAPPPPLDAPPYPHNWLCRHRCRCTGIVAVDAQTSLLLPRLILSPLLHIVKLALSPSSSLLSTSIAIVVAVVSHHAITIIVDFVTHRAVTIVDNVVIPHAIATVVVVVVAGCAITIVVDFVACCAVAIVVAVFARRTITIVVDIVVRCAVAIVINVDGMGVLWRRRRCPTT